MENSNILYLLKHGRSDEVRAYFRTLQKEAYSEDFSSFMEEMIRVHKVKRKDIAIRSGMSQDYTYKLLRGDKKTTERDYILAMCIAIGMNLAQTQHALRVYGMPVLNNKDGRSHVITLGINEGCDIDTIDSWLEKAGLYLIKTNPDMPTAPIIPIMQDASDISTVSNTLPRTGEERKYEELEREIHADRCGNAPMDYSYWGIIKIKDEIGHIYYVEAAYDPEGTRLDVLTEDMHKKFEIQAKAEDEYMEQLWLKYGEVLDDFQLANNDPELEEALNNCPDFSEGIEPLETYDSLVEAAHSSFFKWFLELDNATDEKVLETMREIDDTRNYQVRCGSKIDNGQLYYLEAFNTARPEKREYFQIIQNGEEYIYSVSHESYYMQIELGDFYPAYFGEKKRGQEYFVKVKDLQELTGDYFHYRFIFNELRMYMHQMARDYYGLELTDEELREEQIAVLTQKASRCFSSIGNEDAITALEEAYSLMKEDLNKYLSAAIVTSNKIAVSYYDLGDYERCDKWYKECLQYETSLSEALNNSANRDELGDAPLSMEEAFAHQVNKLHQSGDIERMKEAYLKAISYYRGNCNSTSSWGGYASCMISYAFYIDDEDPELALEYTGEALRIIRDHNLDQSPEYRDRLFTALNNHAWVLWNRVASEEAVIYYGMAIDLAERCLATDNQKLHDEWMKRLRKESKALFLIYNATNKEKEAMRLANRAARYGIDLANEK